MDTRPIIPSQKITLIIFSIFLIFFLIGNYLIAGPIFEGYLYSEYLNSNNFIDSIPNTLGRPLALIPNILIHFVFDDSRFGYFLLSSSLALLRGCTVFLIRKSLGRYSLPIATLVILIPFWQANLNERFIAAQFSINFSFLALCIYIRNPNSKKLILIASTMAILTYPPVALVLPISIVAISTNSLTPFKSLVQKLFGQLWLFLPILAYLFWLILLRMLQFDSYDTRVGNMPTLSAVKNLVKTLIVVDPGITALLFIFPFLLSKILHPKKAGWLTFLSVSLIFISPLTYSQAAIHLNDPERVFFCISLSSLFLSVLILTNRVDSSNVYK